MSRLYIEAGHGGNDPGAIGVKGVREADLTLEFRNGLTAALRLEGYQGVIIHDPDNANLAGAIRTFKPRAEDVLLGLHFNAAASSSATGTEVIVPNTHSSLELELATRLAQVMANELGIPLRPGKVGPGVKRWVETARGSRGVSSGWLAKLGHSIIIEVCFISNPSDLDRYQRQKEKLWQSMAKALIQILIP